MNIKKSFASDNNSGVHPKIMQAIVDANLGHVISYGDDYYTKSAIEKFKEVFGKQIEVFFVYNGTGANVTGISSITDSFNSIICAETAHINEDECGAPEKFTGCKLKSIHTENGKIKPEQVDTFLNSIGFEHHPQPKVISITQTTELGTAYSIEEIKNIADYAHKNNMFLHIDGARIANAAVTLNVSFKQMLSDTGVDILSFGGTKNGMMYGEAVVFFNNKICNNFKYIRKQSMQLASKMRFISAQFSALLDNNLWLENAGKSNEMAKYLANCISEIHEIKITQKVQANAVFAIIPSYLTEKLQKEYFFYVWNEEKSEVRWMTSFDTTKEDIDDFVKKIKKIL